MQGWERRWLWQVPCNRSIKHGQRPTIGIGHKFPRQRCDLLGTGGDTQPNDNTLILFEHATASRIQLPDLDRKERIEELRSDLEQDLLIGVEDCQSGAELLERWVIARRAQHAGLIAGWATR